MKQLSELVKQYIRQSAWRNIYCSVVDADISAAEQRAFMAGYKAAEITDEELDEMYNDFVLNKKEC